MAYLLFIPIAFAFLMNILVFVASVLPGMYPIVENQRVTKSRGLFISTLNLTLCYLAAQYVITLL